MWAQGGQLPDRPPADQAPGRRQSLSTSTWYVSAQRDQQRDGFLLRGPRLTERKKGDRMRHSTILIVVAGALLFAAGCARQPSTQKQEPSTSATETAAPAASTPKALPVAFQTPESVLYDPAEDIFFVSNINGAPLEKDGNGFISRLQASNGQGTDKWIESGVNGVTLNGPKGLTIRGDELWVTDIDTVRRFDLKTGAPKGEIPIPGSTFLNDLSTADDGTVYLTDSGLQAGENGFEPSGTDAVYAIKADNKPVEIASGDELGHPNGVLAVNGEIWVVTFGTNELYRLVDGKKTDVSKLPAGSLDGLRRLADGDFLVSSWASKSVYRGPAGGPFRAIVENVTSPADIGVDTKRNLLLIPSFQENKVEVHPLSGTEGSSPTAP
jgi:sugar lactone lactonase YvrE